jgi:hypothetical protein
MNSESILKISTNQKLKNPVELCENYSSTYAIVGKSQAASSRAKKSSSCLRIYLSQCIFNNQRFTLGVHGTTSQFIKVYNYNKV